MAREKITLAEAVTIGFGFAVGVTAWVLLPLLLVGFAYWMLQT